jgi:phosphonate transport system substrate-binding protein
MRRFGQVRHWGLKAVIGALSFVALTSCSKPDMAVGERTEIHFSILSIQSEQTQGPVWKPFLDDMAKQTGLKITPYFRPNYTALIEGMRMGEVEVGWFSNASGLEAVNRAEGEVFARTTDPSGIDGYKSLIIVRADSPLTPEDLLVCDKKYSLGMGDQTSGTLAPLTYFFLPNGVEPEKCFKSVSHLAASDNFKAVAAGATDAATYNSVALEQFELAAPNLARQVKIIWQSPTLPEDPIIVRKDLDPVTREKIRSFLMTYGTSPGPEGERERKVLKALSFGVFKPADNTHLLPVRQMEASERLMLARASNDADAITKAEASLAQVAEDAKKLANPQAAPDHMPSQP